LKEDWPIVRFDSGPSGLAVYSIRLRKAARRCAGIEDKRHPVWISKPVPKSRAKNADNPDIGREAAWEAFLLLRYGVRVRKTVRIETIE